MCKSTNPKLLLKISAAHYERALWILEAVGIETEEVLETFELFEYYESKISPKNKTNGTT